jgi:hypothetical protein
MPSTFHINGERLWSSLMTLADDVIRLRAE